MGRKAQIYPSPSEDASPKEKEHYSIVAPIQEIRRDYDISREDLHSEICNLLREDISFSAFISWFRVKTGQKWTPPFRVIKILNQAFINILTRRGYKFSKGTRLYYEVISPETKTDLEKDLIKEIRKNKIPKKQPSTI